MPASVSAATHSSAVRWPEAVPAAVHSLAAAGRSASPGCLLTGHSSAARQLLPVYQPPDVRGHAARPPEADRC